MGLGSGDDLESARAVGMGILPMILTRNHRLEADATLEPRAAHAALGCGGPGRRRWRNHRAGECMLCPMRTENAKREVLR